MNQSKYASLLLLPLFFAMQPVQAAVVGYTDITGFNTAISGYITDTLNFDAMNDMDLIASGSTVQGMAFNYDFGGFSMMVVDADVVGISTTSPTNYLGTNNGDMFQDGDNFSIVFDSPVNAFGVSIMTSDQMFDGDISLLVNNSNVDLVASAIQQTLSDGSDVYFLGALDPVGINSIEFSTIGGGFFLYTLDDMRTAVVPVPAAFWLFVSGLAGMIALSRRK